MSQVLPTPMAESVPPVLSAGLAEQYGALAQQFSEGFSGSFNRIKPGKADFTLIEGGVSRSVPNGAVAGVLLGFSSVDFCTWYEKKYAPGQEPEQPDLCWEWADHNTFPYALPAQFRQKVNEGGVERWPFRIARRSVWALVTTNPQTGDVTLGLQNPYVLDITSASLFGKSNTQLNEFKWSGLINFCNRFSQPPNFYCSPAMFMTQIMIDMQSPVPGVVVFRPNIAAGGMSPQYIDNTAFEAVVNAMLSQQVKDMLKVREILTWPRQSSAPAAPAAPATPAQPCAAPTAQTATPAAPQATTQPAGFTTPGPVMQTATASAEPQTPPAPEPAAATQPTAATSLLAQAKAAMARAPQQPSPTAQPQAAPQPAPQPAQPATPIADGVNDTTAAAIDSLTNML